MLAVDGNVLTCAHMCKHVSTCTQQRESKPCHDMVMCGNQWRVQIQHFDNLLSSSSLYFYIAFLLKFRNEHVITMCRYLAWESWLSRRCEGDLGVDLEVDLEGEMEGDSKGDFRGDFKQDMEEDLLSSSGQVRSRSRSGSGYSSNLRAWPWSRMTCSCWRWFKWYDGASLE